MITIELVHPFQQKAVQSWKFDVNCRSVSIGRSRQNDITLMSAVVSRHHAVLKQDDKGWRVEALGTNGCFMEDKPIQKAYLESGAVFRIARTGPRLRFIIDATVAGADEPDTRRPTRLRPEDILTARETWLGGDDD